MSEFKIPYTKHEITPDDIQSVVEALNSDILTNGPNLQNFENMLAAQADAPYAVGVSSGTAGLHLAVEALGTKPEQKVIVPSLTFAATANAVLYSGSAVEFVDIDPKTMLIDIDQVEARIAANPEKYAGVIAVDFAGYPLDMQSLSEICERYDAWLIEDAAHALGAVSKNRGGEYPVGNARFADAVVFSFHPAKHITTGEGGMVTTRDVILSEKIKRLRSHAMDKSSKQSLEEGWYYRINELGYNYRMNELQAALGSSQLKRVAGNVAARNVIAQEYVEAFTNTAIALPEYDFAQTNAYHLFVIRVNERRKIYDGLKQKGIFAQVHYVPLHMQPLYRSVSENEDLAHTEKYYEEALSIPMYPTISSDEQAHVIKVLKDLID